MLRHDLLDVRNDGLLIPGVQLVIASTLLLDEDQLLGHGLVILLPGDIVLLQHLVEDDLLPVLVPLPGAPDFVGVEALGAAEGVGSVLGGVVGDADQAGALGQGQLGHRLSEVAQGGGTHPLVLAAQRDNVQVVHQGIFLGVVLGEAEGADDLGNLPLDGGLVVLGGVFQQLLGDGGAAGNFFAGKHRIYCISRPPPVHPGVGPEPLVLNGHGGVDQVLGNLVVVHPHRAGDVVQLGHLHILPGGLVLVVHDAVLVPGEVVRAHVGDGDDHLVDIHRGEAGDERAGAQADEDQGAHQLEEPADHPAGGDAALLSAAALLGRGGRLTGPAGGTAGRRLAAGRIVAVLVQRGVFIVIRHDKYLQPAGSVLPPPPASWDGQPPSGCLLNRAGPAVGPA